MQERAAALSAPPARAARNLLNKPVGRRLKRTEE